VFELGNEIYKDKTVSEAVNENKLTRRKDKDEITKKRNG
jgi:hypothetical protein